MYVPAVNAVEDAAVVLALLRAKGAGHLVSSTADGSLDATLVPFVIDDAMSVVRVHVARANPHWRSLDGAPALLIVPVADAYVSPGWYPSKAGDPRVVPTWNYELVHVHGTARIRDDPDVVEGIVRDLTEFHESERVERDDSVPAWSVDDAPADFLARQLRAIVGIELVVDRVDAKRKLGQNRSGADRVGVADGLHRSARGHVDQVATSMRSTVPESAETSGD
jgi:transcriptional regulator